MYTATTSTSTRPGPNQTPRAVAERTAHAAMAVGVALNRATSGGSFSVVEYGAVRIDAEPGLVIRVHGGCLWVPHHEDHCSVGVGAGEHFVVGHPGRLTTLASRGTQVELVWPTHTDAAPDLRH